MADLPSHVGSRLRVRASIAGVPDPLEADLFAIDGHRGTAVFRRVHAHTYQKADYFFIPLAAISAFEVLGKSEKTTVTNIGVSEIKRRLKDSTDAEQRKIALRGVGVSEQGQRIFNELLKHYPRAAWFEQTIVLDDLGTLLQPPYAHENIELGKDKSDTYRDYLRRRLESSRALALAS